MNGRPFWTQAPLRRIIAYGTHRKLTRSVRLDPKIRLHQPNTDRRRFYSVSPGHKLTAQDGVARSTSLRQSGQGVLFEQLSKAAAVVDKAEIPSEGDLIKALEICDRLARSISKKVKGVSPSASSSYSPVTNLLGLEEQFHRQAASGTSAKASSGSWRADIEATSLAIINNRNTFITPKLLRLYVNIAVTLRSLQNLPAVFDLYASKPIPIKDSSPVVFKQPDPTSIKAAIPLEIAQLALDAAIEARDLALCLNIISTTVATSAFRRNKVARKVSAPALMVLMTPLAAYQLALKYTESAVRSDPDYAFDHSFLAFLTFFSMTSVMGFYAIVQGAEMDRVTWRPGTKLHTKWTREDERKMADQIAQAWGFQDELKRGEEEGKDWRNLRKWLLSRSMDLDRADLMEGME